MKLYTRMRTAARRGASLRMLLVGGLLVAGAAACSEPVAAAEEGEALEGRFSIVETVQVTPSLDTVVVGETTQLTAKVTDQRGRDRTRSISWSSANPAVATVSPSGVVSGVAAGTVKITATSSWRGATGSATIVVQAATQPEPAPQPAPVATVTLSPASATIDTGATSQLSVTLRDANGNVLTGRAVTWISSSPATATVSSSGLVKGVAAGSATVTATSEGISGQSAITVVAPAPAPEPPPPSGAPVDTIFYDGFESGSLSLWQDGVTASKHQVVTDAALAVGGSRLLKVTMPAGGDGGWLTRFFMPGYDSVFVRLHVRYGADWNGGAKLLSLRGSPVNNQWGGFGNAGSCPNGTDFFSANLTLDRTYDPGPMLFYAYYPGMPDCWGDSGLRTGASYLDTSRGLAKNTWYTVEYWVKLNTVGQRNSEQRFWVNGQQWGEWNGLSFRTTNDLKLNSVQLNLNATASSTPRSLYIDEVLVTTGRP